jgi:hypothetical protein
MSSPSPGVRLAFSDRFQDRGECRKGVLRRGDLGKSEVHHALLAGRQEPFHAQPQGEQISLLGQLNDFPRQCLALAIQQLLQD